MNATIALATLPSVKWAPAVGLDVAPIRRPLRRILRTGYPRVLRTSDGRGMVVDMIAAPMNRSRQ